MLVAGIGTGCLVGIGRCEMMAVGSSFGHGSGMGANGGYTFGISVGLGSGYESVLGGHGNGLHFGYSMPFGCGNGHGTGYGFGDGYLNGADSAYGGGRSTVRLHGSRFVRRT